MVSRHRLKRRVQFHETDAAGIVHFSWFFKYMEEAEHAMWREAGLSIAVRGAEVGWPRVAASFEFHRPLRFEDEFDVLIRVVAIAEKTIRYVCLITKDATKIASGTMTVACVSKRQETMRSIAIPPEITARFQVEPEEAERP